MRKQKSKKKLDMQLFPKMAKRNKVFFKTPKSMRKKNIIGF